MVQWKGCSVSCPPSGAESEPSLGTIPWYVHLGAALRFLDAWPCLPSSTSPLLLVCRSVTRASKARRQICPIDEWFAWAFFCAQKQTRRPWLRVRRRKLSLGNLDSAKLWLLCIGRILRSYIATGRPNAASLNSFQFMFSKTCFFFKEHLITFWTLFYDNICIYVCIYL
jgi:hypothetical protein